MTISYFGISKRRITLSTSGLAPRILELPGKAPEVNLAISLNATTDAVRDRLMPVNKKYPIRALLAACRRFPLRPRRLLTFEYVLIDGVNDSVEDGRRLVGLLRGLRCKVNLIPLNAPGPHAGSDLRRPSVAAVLAFRKVLEENGIAALIRESRGQDILAACGQLRGKYSVEQAVVSRQEKKGIKDR
jgi:23S rRNA (adenine2503-C2)-methyltransferase